METRPSRVLIVHGVAATRAALAQSLADDNLAVVEAASGRAALDRVAAEPLDLILLDTAAPDVDGFRLLTLVKTDSRLCHIPVIMIATRDDEDGIARCLEAGAEDYLQEPCHPALLRLRVDAAIEKKWLRDNEATLQEGIAASRLSQENLLQDALAAAKHEIAQLQETIKALRRQLDSTTATAQGSIDAARASAAAELRQLRATCRVLREQLNATIAGAGTAGAPERSSDGPKGRTSDGR